MTDSFDITAHVGTDYRATFDVSTVSPGVTGDPEPWDLSAAEFVLHMRNFCWGTSIPLVVDGDKVLIHLSAEFTATLDPGLYSYHVNATHPSGDVQYLWGGALFVRSDDRS